MHVALESRKGSLPAALFRCVSAVCGRGGCRPAHRGAPCRPRGARYSVSLS
ncbi:hypothetical protein BURMUCF2_0122 [Burkholderia multivorans CF2]|nr:hypothetical protein BURMUCF2_0122 [Burkholderia multivorans CF2]